MSLPHFPSWLELDKKFRAHHELKDAPYSTIAMAWKQLVDEWKLEHEHRLREFIKWIELTYVPPEKMMLKQQRHAWKTWKESVLGAEEKKKELGL